MLKSLIKGIIQALGLMGVLAHAQTGLLFTITQSGNAATVDIVLCLNGIGALSCQNYHVSAENLKISTVAPHFYSTAGIKVLNPGYQPTGCIPYPNGYCLFATSDTKQAILSLNSTSAKQNQTITFTSVPPSPATVGGTYLVTAVANSGLPVTVTVDSSSGSVCTLSGNTVTFDTAGSCILNANQAGNENYNPAPQTQQAITVVSLNASLTISSPILILAQAGIFTAASGASPGTSKSRTLTITNQGQGTATNLTIVFTPPLSGGTTVDTTASPACTSATILAQNDSCTITIVPGTPSTVASVPVTNNMVVTANNSSNSVSSAITTLTYGSLYGDGYVFSIDDSTPSTSNVGLVKVAAINDQTISIPWDADPSCNGGAQCTYATGAISTTDGTNAPGGNTYLISSILTNASPPVGDTNNPPTYAGGFCINYTSSSNYNDWYLPAICEMAYFGVGDNSANCGTQSAPALQNMQSNLIDIDDSSSVALGLVNGGNSSTFWSSREDPNTPLTTAWIQVFALDGSQSAQGGDYKTDLYGARCIRGFIP